MIKFSKRYVIYYKTFIDFISLFGLFIFFSIGIIDEETNTNLFYSNPYIWIPCFTGVTIIYLITLLFRILYYKLSFYELRDTKIYEERGVIFKRKSFLDYSKIHSVNKKQNIIQKIFKCAKLEIDSGSTNTAYTAEIEIFEDEDKLTELMNKIDSKQKLSGNLEENETNDENLEIVNEEIYYKYSNMNKFLYSLFNFLITLLCFGIIGILGLILFSFVTMFYKIELIDYLYIILGTIGSIAGFALISFLMFLIANYVNYYDFKIYKSGNNINISYGIIQKSLNSFNINKVKAILIKHNIIARIFKYVSVDIEVIGYGEQNNKSISRLLIPLCKEEEVQSYLNKMFPNYVNFINDNKCKSLFSLFSFEILFYFLGLGILYLIFLPFALMLLETKLLLVISLVLILISILYVLFVIIKAKFMYHVQNISINDEKIIIHNGAFNIQDTIILKENLIGITKITTPMREKKNIYSYVIHFKSNSSFNTIRVNSLDLDVYQKIINLITF